MRHYPLALLGLLLAMSVSASSKYESPHLPAPQAAGYVIVVDGRKPLTMKVDGKDITEGKLYIVYRTEVTVTITFMQGDEKITQDMDITLREGYQITFTITLPGPRADA